MSIDRTVLIADDEPDFRLGVAELLGRLGLSFRMAQTGPEALDLVRLGGIHLALLDHQMPSPSGPTLTGLDVLHAIRDETLGVPAILCSADTGHDLERMALAAGALTVLRKPVEPVLLRREVQRALGLA